MTLELRQSLLETARALNRSGLNQGTSGNLSVRLPGGDADRFSFLVTPSALPYDDLTPDDLVELGSDGSVRGRRKPSSEWSMHLEVLRARPEIQAVLHAHPTYCTALACQERGIPAFHYMVAVAGGSDIRCAAYATFGSEALARLTVQALAERQACLLAHHGMVALGQTPASALELSIEVETLARQYWHALVLGPPPLLDEAEMMRVLGKFADYKRQG